MKTLLLALLSLILVSHLAKAQTPDWKWQNPKPTGNNLMDIQFLNQNLGWAVGWAGTIIKTTDGGENWVSQFSGSTDNFWSLKFVDSLTGWVVGYYGDILKTTDGGTSWQQQNVGLGALQLSSILFINSQKGWTVGRYGKILKTINGGATWLIDSLPTSSFFYSIHFIDSMQGWVAGSMGKIYHTTDGGNSWVNQNSGLPNNIYLKRVQFLDSQNGFASGAQGKIIKTTNGGNTWEPLEIGTNYDIDEHYFLDSQVGFVSSRNKFFKTINGGTSWIEIATAPNFSVNRLFFLDNQNGYGVGNGGFITKTSSGGLTWSMDQNNFSNPICHFKFLGPSHGIAVGRGTNSVSILKTSNGGADWYGSKTNMPNWIRNGFFIDLQKGWIVGKNGSIFKTINGGKNWQPSEIGTTKDLFSVQFIDHQTGWLVGDSGFVAKTIDGGLTWLPQSPGTLHKFYSVFFTDTQTGWIAGDTPSAQGKIWKTENGGSTWVEQNSGGISSILSIKFLTNQIGWVVSNSGEIFKSTNGGLDWSSQESGTSFSLNDVFFIDQNIGWVVGSGGVILKTTNGGENWVKQSSGTSNTMFVVYPFDENSIWVGGQYSNILTTSNNPFSIENPKIHISGTLFSKNGANCDPSNIPIQGLTVKANPGNFYGYSGSNGIYHLSFPKADTTIMYQLQPVELTNTQIQSNAVCPPSGQIQFLVDSLTNNISGKNFGFEVTECHHLNVQISSNRRRRCFKNNTTVSYVNQGVLPAPSAYILVEFPKWVRPISASVPHIVLNDTTWKFELGTVAAGIGGNIYIVDSVICGHPEIRNQTQCTRATIFPAPDCPPPSGWSGAEISVVSQCNNGMVDFGVYNATAFAMTDSVDYWVYLDSIQVKVGKIKLAAGDSLHFWVQTNGMTASLTINQVAGHPSSVFVSAVVEDCSNTTFYPRQMANQFPKSQTPNSKMHCLPIRDSYDPNDKQAFPIGFTANRIVKPGTQMEYLIRFQNTGNDTAYTVYVIDSLDKNLNVESLELGAVSHPYDISLQTTRQGRNFLRFQFNNINLPDSNTNELRSHGFIQYRISPKIGLPLGSQASNKAEIYFDFNPAVVTNQTLTTFDNITFTNPALNPLVQVITSSKSTFAKQIGVKLYPNPVTQNQLTVEFETHGSLAIFNAQGQQLLEQQNLAGKQQINLNISPGIYWVKLQTTEGVSVQKLVKR